MKQGSTSFLKIALIIMGLPVLALCIFLLPKWVSEAVEVLQASGGDSQLAYIVLGILAIMYLSAIPYYFVLYQSYKLLRYIDKNKAFSDISVVALKKIKVSALIISGLYVLALPLVFAIAEWDDAPGLVIIGAVPAGASLVIAVFAAVLQRLLQEAIHIKSENDLTV